jgi:hypothetical protein
LSKIKEFPQKVGHNSCSAKYINDS